MGERILSRLGFDGAAMLRRRVSRAAWPVIAALLALPAPCALSQPANTVIEVRPGDSFSAIATRIVGDVRKWRQLYRAEGSGLPNPNLILAGSHLELVTEPGGGRYLRLMDGAGARAARVANATPAPPPARVPRPATPAAPAAPAAPVAPTAPPAPVAAVASAPEPRAAELVIGVLPNIGAELLMSQYASLKHYLERVGGQPVRIVLPANFKTFFESTMKGDYDLAVSAPHLARVAQLDGKLVPLVVYEPRINALFITPTDSPLASPQDLRAHALVFANPQSLVALYGRQWLGQLGLEAGRDYEVKAARTDLGVGRMLLTGEAAAAIMSNGEFRSLPQDEAVRLKIVEVFARIPNFIVLANPRLDAQRMSKLKEEFKAFLGDKDDGAAFARATGINGINDVDEAMLRELDAFAPATRRAMGVVK
jgi:phosphonate transport system substrate-binding protein